MLRVLRTNQSRPEFARQVNNATNVFMSGVHGFCFARPRVQVRSCTAYLRSILRNVVSLLIK